MDCGFNINVALPDEVTVVDAYADYWKNTSVGGGRDYLRQQITSIIDRIGEASAQSQGLLSPVTSVAKLRASDHRIYILKDANAYQGRGGIIGFMKVAKKKLFLTGPGGTKVEAEPLCILDFYVEVPLQRKGYGEKLFKYVMQREKAQPSEVAIDRPTQKMLGFMASKFGLIDVVRQPSHFVVFADFFGGVTDSQVKATSGVNGLGEKSENGTRRSSVENEPLGTENAGNGQQLSDHVNGYFNGQGAGLANGKPSHKDTDVWDDMVGGHMRKTNGRNLHHQHTQLW